MVLACVNYYPHKPWPGSFPGIVCVNHYSYCAVWIWSPSAGSGKYRHVVTSLAMTRSLRIWEQSLGWFISLGNWSLWKLPETLELKFRSIKLHYEFCHRTQHSNTLFSALSTSSLYEDIQRAIWINIFMSNPTYQDAMLNHEGLTGVRRC